MFKCLRCGAETVRLTPHQIHCQRCEREVAALVAADAARRVARFAPKDLSGWTR